MDDWEEYLAARNSGIKKIWTLKLNERVRHITSLNEEALERYVEALFTTYFDRGQHTIPIQHPVIWNKVLPVLSRKVKEGSPKYRLWAYKAYGFAGVFKLMGNDPKQILRNILEEDNGNSEACQLLMEDILNSLDYAMHELPDVLLVKEDVCLAMIAECRGLIANNAQLDLCKSRFGLDLGYYQHVLHAWIEYCSVAREGDFDDWLESQGNSKCR